MPTQRMCRDCGRSIIAYSTLDNRCISCKKKVFKPIKKRGKRTIEYEKWRDEVAKPYLDNTFGHTCAYSSCLQTSGLEVDHIKNRGSHIKLKMDVGNVQWLCNYHHRLKTDGKL